jgi:hypothetical protein
MSAAQASTPFGKVGKEQTDAMVNMQKEILDAYEQANRAWLERVKSEVEFWSDRHRSSAQRARSRKPWRPIRRAWRSACKWRPRTGDD